MPVTEEMLSGSATAGIDVLAPPSDAPRKRVAEL